MNNQILLINSSQHLNGNTVQMGMRLLKKYDYKNLSLINYRVGFFGTK